MYNIAYHGDADLSAYSFLVTGGAGFIGSNLIEYLLKFGAKKVRALDNFSTGSRENIREFYSHPAFELIEADIRDLNTCRNAVKEIDFVSHQAALGSVPRSINDPVTSNEVNINGFLNMLVAARDEQVKRMIYASSSSVYGDSPTLPKVEDNTGKPLSPYAVTKYVNELYADVFSKIYQFHTIGLRYFNVFGPKQNPKGPYAAVIPLFIQAALQQKAPVIFGDGETSRDFTFIENVVQANIKALLCNTTSHHAINIAFGSQITLNQLWNEISNITHSNFAPVYQAERPGDVKHSLANISKAVHLLNYQPAFSLFESLDITINSYNLNSK